MKKELFNDNWLYWKESNAFALLWKTGDGARRVTLPHDAMMEDRAFPESVNGGNSGFRDGSVCYYSKEFTPTEEMLHQTVMLHFEGVYRHAFVYVNAQLAAKWTYGYTGFYVKLNDFLDFGKKNEIRVVVRNSGMPNSRWYSGTGIYRDVYLLTGGETFFRPDGFRIDTESVDDGVGVVRVRSTVINRCPGRRELTLVCKVRDDSGRCVTEERLPLTVYEGEEREISRRFAIRDAKLWSDETPNLYELETSLYDIATGECIDSAAVPFGIRTLSVDPVRGLRVNGKSVKLRGACIHHDNGLVGSATYYDFHYRQIRRLKESGFNAIRMSHHPAAPALLRACDELGMYVMDECFDMWTRAKTANDYALDFEKNWEQDVEAMVRADYCHPSVILYSLGNEIPEIGSPRGAQIACQIASKIRSLDTGRITLTSVNGLFAIGTDLPEILDDVMTPEEKKTMVASDGNVNDFMATMAHGDDIIRHPIVSARLAAAAAATDIIGYNYMTPRYKLDAAENPNRVIVGSETYRASIAENWGYVKKIPSLLGDFVWTGWDYLGESGIGIATYSGSGDGFGTPYPCIMAYSGDIDITGFRKPASYFADIVFGTRTQPYLCVQDPVHFSDRVNKTPWSLTDKVENWTYPGKEDMPVRVEVYSAGDETELFVNGKSCGRKPAGESGGYRAEFETVYKPGTIEAVSYEGGKEAGRFAVRTAGKADLMISIEKGRTGKLTFIDIDAKDAEGVLSYEQGAEITASVVSGAATVFIGTGNHSPLESYAEGSAKLWNGRAQVVVVKDDPESEVIVKVLDREITV